MPVFYPNPLSLSVPEPAFESWLRDSGYLEILDQRTTDLHRLSAAAPAKNPSDSAADAATTSISSKGVFFISRFLSSVWTLLSLLTFSPFSKLAADDFSGDTPPWTVSFFGALGSYSFPSSPSQARLRVHENVKRFARNYATLCVLFFACALYQLPIALCGLISCLALWDGFKLSGDRWGLDRYPVIRQTLFRIAQCVTFISYVSILWRISSALSKYSGNLLLRFVRAISSRTLLLGLVYYALRATYWLLVLCYSKKLITYLHHEQTPCSMSCLLDTDKASLPAVTLVILFVSNVSLAIVRAFVVSYAVMILHASFRKLTPSKQPALRGGYKKIARRPG